MNDEKKLEEIFENKKASRFNKLILKAKVFSIIKGIVISTLVITILGFLVLYYNAITLNELGNKKLRGMQNFYNIAKPNSYIGTNQQDDRFMIGELNFTKYRFVGNKAVYDGNYKETYGYMNIINRLYGDNGDYLFMAGAESEQELEEVQTYNKFGRRKMKFYHPSINCENYINDLVLLSNINNEKLVEISLSFNKEYTIDEVKTMLPENVTLNWLWVNTYDEEVLNNMRSHKDINGKSNPEDGNANNAPNVIETEDDVYGIKALDGNGKKIYAPENDFIDMICNAKSIEGTYTTPYETLFNKLSKDNNTINKSDIKIIGVVVSGDARLVEQLKGQPFIKASTFGAIVDKY